MFHSQAIDTVLGHQNITIRRYEIPRILYDNTITNIRKAIATKCERGICKAKSTKDNPDLFKQHQSYYLHNAPKKMCQWCFSGLLMDIANYINNVSSENMHYNSNSAQICDLLKKMVCYSISPDLCYSIIKKVMTNPSRNH